MKIRLPWSKPKPKPAPPPNLNADQSLAAFGLDLLKEPSTGKDRTGSIRAVVDHLVENAVDPNHRALAGCYKKAAESLDNRSVSSHIHETLAKLGHAVLNQIAYKETGPLLPMLVDCGREALGLGGETAFRSWCFEQRSLVAESLLPTMAGCLVDPSVSPQRQEMTLLGLEATTLPVRDSTGVGKLYLEVFRTDEQLQESSNPKTLLLEVGQNLAHNESDKGRMEALFPVARRLTLQAQTPSEKHVLNWLSGFANIDGSPSTNVDHRLAARALELSLQEASSPNQNKPVLALAETAQKLMEQVHHSEDAQVVDSFLSYLEKGPEPEACPSALTDAWRALPDSKSYRADARATLGRKIVNWVAQPTSESPGRLLVRLAAEASGELPKVDGGCQEIAKAVYAQLERPEFSNNLSLQDTVLLARTGAHLIENGTRSETLHHLLLQEMASADNSTPAESLARVAIKTAENTFTDAAKRPILEAVATQTAGLLQTSHPAKLPLELALKTRGESAQVNALQAALGLCLK